MTHVFNKHQELEKRRLLRQSSPEAEELLWSRLRRDQLFHCKFRRQYSVGPFVIDFYCPAAKLAVEVDGPSHAIADAPGYDKGRQDYIESFGIQFLRFSNSEVRNAMNGVLACIEAAVRDRLGDTDPP